MRDPLRAKTWVMTTAATQMADTKTRVENGASMSDVPCLAAQPWRTCFVPLWTEPKLLGRNNVPTLFSLVKRYFAGTAMPLKVRRPSANWPAIPQAELTYRCQP